MVIEDWIPPNSDGTWKDFVTPEVGGYLDVHPTNCFHNLYISPVIPHVYIYIYAHLKKGCVYIYIYIYICICILLG